MFILACGRESTSTVEPPAAQQPQPSYETILPRRGTSWFQPRTQSNEGSDGPNRMWRHSASENHRGPFRRLDTAMNEYDNIAAQVAPLAVDQRVFSKYEPSYWTLARPGNSKNKAWDSKYDKDEMAIPEHHVGFYQVFCQPQSWSPVFASPGDFTVKMASVSLKNGEICFRLAIICSCVKAIRDGVHIEDNSRRKYYVKHVERSQHELIRFAKAMTMRYVGHRLVDMLPRFSSLLGAHAQSALDGYGEAVTVFLSYLLSISEIGFNRLVTLTEPVVKNLIVREFLDLSLGYGDPAMISTSSCDARIEGKDSRPMLPSEWLDVDTHSAGQFKNRHSGMSPIGAGMVRSFSHTGDAFDLACRYQRSQSDRFRLSRATPTAKSSPSKCIHFVTPCEWQDSTFIDGAFTVEISGISIADGHANFAVSILSYAHGGVEITNVDRRYSEFDELVRKIESKIPALQIRKLLPPKTFFRSLSARFLERRAAHLQAFLEKILQMHFLGILDQNIPITAEPTLRRFLQLPNVEWSLVPWNRDPWKAPVPYRRNPSFSASPTAAMDNSPMYISSPVASMYGPYGQFTPRYESIVKRRSDSM